MSNNKRDKKTRTPLIETDKTIEAVGTGTAVAVSSTDTEALALQPEVLVAKERDLSEREAAFELEVQEFELFKRTEQEKIAAAQAEIEQKKVALASAQAQSQETTQANDDRAKVLAEQVSAIASKEADLIAQVARLDDQERNLVQKREDLELEKAHFRELRNALDTQQSSLQLQQEILETQRAHIQELRSDFEADNVALKDERSRFYEEKGAYEASVAETQKAVEDMANESFFQSSSSDTPDLTNVATVFARSLVFAQNSVSSLSQESARIASDLEKLQARVDSLETASETQAPATPEVPNHTSYSEVNDEELNKVQMAIEDELVQQIAKIQAKIDALHTPVPSVDTSSSSAQPITPNKIRARSGIVVVDYDRTANKASLERDRNKLLETYRQVLVNHRSFELTTQVPYVALNDAHQQLLCIMQMGIDQIKATINKSSYASYVFTDPKLTAYRSLVTLSNQLGAIPNNENVSGEDRKALSLCVAELSYAFNGISYLLVDEQNNVTKEKVLVKKLLLEDISSRMAELQTKTGGLLGSKNEKLQTFGKVLMIMGLAIGIAIASLSIMMAVGVTMPAMLMSVLATLNATQFVTQAVGFVTTLSAAAGVEMSVATATTATALLGASTVSLFGKAAHVMGDHSSLKRDMDKAARDIANVAVEERNVTYSPNC